MRSGVGSRPKRAGGDLWLRVQWIRSPARISISLGVVQPQVARGVARGSEPARLAVRVDEFDLTTVHAVHAGHGAGVVGGASVGVAMEHDDIAGLIALGIGCLHPGQPLVDQAFDHQRLAMKDAFVQETFAHRLVDVPADQVGGRKHRRAFPFHLRECEPALRRGPSQLIRRRFTHPVAQARDRPSWIALPGGGDGGEKSRGHAGAIPRPSSP